MGKEMVGRTSQRVCSVVIQEPPNLPSKKSGLKTHRALVWPSGCVSWNPLSFCSLGSAYHLNKS